MIEWFVAQPWYVVLGLCLVLAVAARPLIAVVSNLFALMMVAAMMLVTAVAGFVFMALAAVCEVLEGACAWLTQRKS